MNPSFELDLDQFPATDRIREAAAAIGWDIEGKDNPRLNAILEHLHKENILHGWQLLGLDSSQWRSLQVPMGLAAAVRHIATLRKGPTSSAGMEAPPMPGPALLRNDSLSTQEPSFHDDEDEESLPSCSHLRVEEDGKPMSATTIKISNQSVDDTSSNGFMPESITLLPKTTGRESSKDESTPPVSESSSGDRDSPITSGTVYRSTPSPLNAEGFTNRTLMLAPNLKTPQIRNTSRSILDDDEEEGMYSIFSPSSKRTTPRVGIRPRQINSIFRRLSGSENVGGEGLGSSKIGKVASQRKLSFSSALHRGRKREKFHENWIHIVLLVNLLPTWNDQCSALGKVMILASGTSRLKRRRHAKAFIAHLKKSIGFQGDMYGLSSKQLVNGCTSLKRVVRMAVKQRVEMASLAFSRLVDIHRQLMQECGVLSC